MLKIKTPAKRSKIHRMQLFRRNDSDLLNQHQKTERKNEKYSQLLN